MKEFATGDRELAKQDPRMQHSQIILRDQPVDGTKLDSSRADMGKAPQALGGA